MGILDNTKQSKRQVFFGEGRRIKIINRPVKYGSLIEYDKNVIHRGWPDYYCNDYYFPGYKNLPAGVVTIGYDRDILLDLFNSIPIGENQGNKPDIKNEDSVNKWIGRKGESQRHIYSSERKSTLKEDIINYSLIGVLGIMIIAWLISFAAAQVGG